MHRSDLRQPGTDVEDTPRPRVVAVIPALDEAPSIARVVWRLRGRGMALESVIVVDNGSTDGTSEIAREAGACVVREERRGYGYACRAGVLAARDADVIVLLDGDAADDPDDLPRLLEPLLEGEADLVVGSRSLGSREHGSMTPIKSLATVWPPGLYGKSTASGSAIWDRSGRSGVAACSRSTCGRCPTGGRWR